MIKNIIRQLLHLAKRLYAQLSDSEIVRIVKAWTVRLLGKKEEQTSKLPQQKAIQKTQQKSNANAPTPSLVQQMQQFINDRWNLRFNELENNIELQDKSGEDADFQLITERSHNTLIMHVQNTLPQCYRSWMDGYLYSDTIPAYHPIQHYLDHHHRWDTSISWLSVSEFFDELKTQSPRPLQGVTIKRITKEMRRLGVPRRHLSEGNVWGVKKR